MDITAMGRNCYLIIKLCSHTFITWQRLNLDKNNDTSLGLTLLSDGVIAIKAQTIVTLVNMF